METELIEYVRDRKGRPFGCVAAVGKDKIGYSICHKEDQFDKKLGRKIAIERAKKEEPIEERIVGEKFRKMTKGQDIDLWELIKTQANEPRPRYYKSNFTLKKVLKMKERAKNYFK